MGSAEGWVGMVRKDHVFPCSRTQTQQKEPYEQERGLKSQRAESNAVSLRSNILLNFSKL